MGATEMAARLNGREYRDEMTWADIQEAKVAGLVVVFGASDDLIEFRGAIDAEGGAYGGTTAYVTHAGLLLNDCDNDRCPHFKKLEARAATIEAKWDCEGYSWVFETEIPHATFEILEDGEKYCRGIVFALADVQEPPQ